MSEWIDVKTKLPDDGKQVLVWFTRLYNEPKVAFHHNGSFYPYKHNDEDITKWVTHWMNLPHPPEGLDDSMTYDPRPGWRS